MGDFQQLNHYICGQFNTWFLSPENHWGFAASVRCNGDSSNTGMSQRYAPVPHWHNSANVTSRKHPPRTDGAADPPRTTAATGCGTPRFTDHEPSFYILVFNKLAALFASIPPSSMTNWFICMVESLKKCQSVTDGPIYMHG